VTVDLFDFDGDTYDRDRDQLRLSGMMARVAATMADGQWHTLHELAVITGGSEAAVSARLRDLRKPRFGGHVVERRYIEGGLWEYRHDHHWCHVGDPRPHARARRLSDVPWADLWAEVVRREAERGWE
jgi:hypothetical protein